MIYQKKIALQTAELLLKIKAVKLSPKEPFTWASGILSPIYCDNRIILSYPDIRTHVRQQFVRAIQEHFPEPELIAGVATGGIPHGALVAQEMGLPFAYVRSSKKEHGLTNQVEGEVRPEQRVVVVEDLISTGSSSLGSVQALREKGCKVLGMVAIFTYNIPVSEEKFQAANCPFLTLTDYDNLMEKALETGYISPGDIEMLREFKQTLANK
jgi:orotate phosphoribosyltransferase